MNSFYETPDLEVFILDEKDVVTTSDKMQELNSGSGGTTQWGAGSTISF